MILPEDDEERAKYRPMDYDLNYFPDAQLAKAKHSYENNIKHTGKPGMVWAHEKSIGDGNQIRRHLLEGLYAAFKTNDPVEAEYHLTAMDWRADELLQRFLKRMPPFEHLPLDSLFANQKKDEAETKNETIFEASAGADLPKPMSFALWRKRRGWKYSPLADFSAMYAQYLAAFKESNKRPDSNGSTAENVAEPDI